MNSGMGRSSFRQSTRKAVFLHIQKTGGTSIINMAKKYYNSLCSHGDCWGRPSSDFYEFDFVSGHLGYNYLADFIKNRYSFTFLRDPLDRIISLYYFCRKRDPREYEIYRMANVLSFEQFLHAGFKDKLIKEYIWNNQTWQLACGYYDPKGRCHDDFRQSELLSLAIEHAMTFSRIGITETLEEDKKLIASDLGLTDCALNNPCNVNPDRPKKEDISSLELELLCDLTYLDRALYSHIIHSRPEGKSRRF